MVSILNIDFAIKPLGVQMEKREASACWNLYVPKPLDQAVDKVINADWHQTKAEFIRQAVREKLTSLGVKPPKIEKETQE